MKNQLKTAQLNLLKQFIIIAQKLDIPYFAIGGTAIGAIRHQGYIPWDDDIDVCMLKEDYERFVVEAPKLLPSHLFLQTIKTEPNYILNGYAKLRNSETTFIEGTVSHIDMNHGIYIDIFVCYYVPQNKISRYWHYFLQRLYKLRLGCEVNPASYYSKSGSLLKKMGRFVTRMLLPLLLFNPKSVRKQLDKLFCSTPKSENVVLADSTWGVNGYPRKWFEETVKVPFEGIEVCLPKEYDKFLRARFGDYMQLPPEEQREAHHYADVIDPDKPYTEYIKN